MFANWGKYQRHCKCADADLLPHINNVSDAAGSLRPAASLGHSEHFILYTHAETQMLAGSSVQLNKLKKDEEFWPWNLTVHPRVSVCAGL